MRAGQQTCHAGRATRSEPRGCWWHKSVAMRQRYVDLKPGDIAKIFGIGQDCLQASFMEYPPDSRVL